jgi:uncharacterized membrane protein (DUF485 family)
MRGDRVSAGAQICSTRHRRAARRGASRRAGSGNANEESGTSSRTPIAVRDRLAPSILTYPAEGEFMASPDAINWSAVIADPRFQTLHRRKTKFLWGLMIFSVVYYFLLPVGAAYYQDLFKVRVWGVINVGLLFALSEFVVAWAIALFYSRVANRQFDGLAAEIAADFTKRAGG